MCLVDSETPQSNHKRLLAMLGVVYLPFKKLLVRQHHTSYVHAYIERWGMWLGWGIGLLKSIKF